MALYSDKVMDHFRNPRNVGQIDDADGIGEVGNAKCGDIMRMYLKIDDDGIITDVKFNTFGCGSAIATSSMATELIKGKSVDEALALSNQAVVEALDGLPTHKIHCSVLAEQAVRAAVKDYYDRKGIAYNPEDFREVDDEKLHEHCEVGAQPPKSQQGPLPSGSGPCWLYSSLQSSRSVWVKPYFSARARAPARPFVERRPVRRARIIRFFGEFSKSVNSIMSTL